MDFGLRDEILNKIKSIAIKYDYDFVMFGSRARGDYKNNSDIDIAIIGDVSLSDKMKIRIAFDEIDMEYILDIVFVNEITSIALIENIKKEGVKI